MPVDRRAFSSYGEKLKAFREIFICAETCDNLENAIVVARKAGLLPVVGEAFRREMKTLAHTLLATGVAQQNACAGAERLAPPAPATCILAATSDDSLSSPEKMSYSPSMETLLELFPPAPVKPKFSNCATPSSTTVSLNFDKSKTCTATIKFTRIEVGRREKYFCYADDTRSQVLCSSTTGMMLPFKGIAFSIADLFSTATRRHGSFVEDFGAGPTLQYSVGAAATSSTRLQKRGAKRSRQPTTSHRRKRSYTGPRRRHYGARGRLMNICRIRKRLAKVKAKRRAKQASKVIHQSLGPFSVLVLLKIVFMWTLLWLFKQKQRVTMPAEYHAKLDGIVSGHCSSSSVHAAPKYLRSSSTHHTACKDSSSHNLIVGPVPHLPTYADIVRHKQGQVQSRELQSRPGAK